MATTCTALALKNIETAAKTVVNILKVFSNSAQNKIVNRLNTFKNVPKHKRLTHLRFISILLTYLNYYLLLELTHRNFINKKQATSKL